MTSLNVYQIFKIIIFMLGSELNIESTEACKMYQLSIDILDASNDEYTDVLYLLDSSFRNTRFGTNNHACVFTGGNDLFKCGGTIDVYEQARFLIKKKSIIRSDDLSLDIHLRSKFKELMIRLNNDSTINIDNVLSECKKDC